MYDRDQLKSSTQQALINGDLSDYANAHADELDDLGLERHLVSAASALLRVLAYTYLCPASTEPGHQATVQRITAALTLLLAGWTEEQINEVSALAYAEAEAKAAALWQVMTLADVEVC